MKKIFKKILNRFELAQNRKKNAALLALPKFEGITLVDIGAAGDIQPRWKAVEPNLNYIGFEPDERSREKLVSNKTFCREYTIFPDAILDNAGMANLNLCRKPQVSSTYMPNLEFINRFPDPRRYDVLKTDLVPTKKLDDVKINNPDFIKLDVHGAELKILLGAEKVLEETFGLEIEAEFLPIYINQALFGDISSFLAKKDFEFIDFVNLQRWGRGSLDGYGQCIFGDVLYLKAPEVVASKNLGEARMSSYLGILLLYKRFDLIKKVLEILPENQRSIYSNFENKLKRIERSHNTARKISLQISRILRFVETDTRTYLLY